MSRETWEIELEGIFAGARLSGDICKDIMNTVRDAVIEANETGREDGYEEGERYGYDEGYERGKEENESPFPNVNDATLENLETGLTLLSSDPEAAAVYINRVLQDFGTNKIFKQGKMT